MVHRTNSLSVKKITVLFWTKGDSDHVAFCYLVCVKKFSSRKKRLYLPEKKGTTAAGNNFRRCRAEAVIEVVVAFDNNSTLIISSHLRNSQRH